MRDIYLIANCKFSNMDIIILFFFINLSLSPSYAPFHPPFPHPSSALSFKIFHFLFRINCPLYRAKKKDYHLYHTRTHTRTHTHMHTHT